MGHWAEYDYLLVNSDLNRSVEVVRSILIAERQRRERQVGLSNFIEGLIAEK
jgi:guanylate kinase